MNPNIFIPKDKREMKTLDQAMSEMIPLRIRCPDCRCIYSLFIKDFDQGLYCMLGQACPYCKRFIRESDKPENLLIDLKEIREMFKDDKNEKK